MSKKLKRIKPSKKLILENIKSPKSENIKNTKFLIFSKRRLINSVGIIFLMLILYFTLNKKTTKSFNCTLASTDNISFKVAKKTKEYTSPLCGCLDDSASHFGILLSGNDITLKRDSMDKEFNQSNFLITSPTFSIPEPTEGFSFKANFFSIVDSENINLFNIEKIKTKKIYSQRRFLNVPFLSIVENENLSCKIFGRQKILAFIPSHEDKCDINVLEDKYEHRHKGVQLTEQYNYFDKEDKIVPRIDILGDSVAFIWRGKPKILSNYGNELILGKFPDTLNYINVLIVKSPFSTRLSFLSWNPKMELFWRKRYLSQFKYAGLFLNDFPYLFHTPNGDSVADIRNIKEAVIPNFYTRDSGRISVTINELLSDEDYKMLYQYYIKNGGINIKFDSGSYVKMSRVNIIPSDLKKHEFERLVDHENEIMDSSSVHEIQDYSRRMREELKDAKFDTLKTSKEYLEEAYFRYPPIYSSNSISIFNDVSEFKMSGAIGNIVIDGKSFSITKNNIIEFKNLKNCEFNYPVMILGLEKPVDFKLAGEGIINIDGQEIGKSIFETNPVIIISLIFTFLGFFSINYSIFKRK